MEQQFVIFHLDQENYGLPIEAVESIINHQPITSLPQTFPFIKGVINLRGKITPIMNLRDRLRLSHRDLDNSSRIVITKHAEQTIGLMVDRVDEVLTLETEELEDVPPVAASINQKYIQAVAKQGERILILLNLKEILTVLDEALPV